MGAYPLPDGAAAFNKTRGDRTNSTVMLCDLIFTAEVTVHRYYHYKPKERRTMR